MTGAPNALFPHPLFPGTTVEIPFQSQPPETRRCGAAALAMVYASLGLSRAQEEIWEAVTEPDRHGKPWARTYRLARHAREQGLEAVVFQAAQPWAVLAHCWRHEIRVILNHRLRADSRQGHFSVLAGIGPEEVLLHDPQFGPARRVTRPELLRLWLPTLLPCEIAGNVLVAVAPRGSGDAACRLCQATEPRHILCPGCHHSVELTPHAALGCTRADCPARLWRYVFCPQCDRALGTA